MPIREAYRKLKERNPGYLLAFGIAEYFEFRYLDAKEIHTNLPDVPYDDTVEYDRILVHRNGFFPFCARLMAKGLKVAMVARKKVGGKVRFEISGRSDE